MMSFWGSRLSLLGARNMSSGPGWLVRQHAVVADAEAKAVLSKGGVKVGDAKSLEYNVAFHVAFARDEVNGPTLIFSPEGGAPIEQTLKDHPEVVVSVPLKNGLSDQSARELAYSFGFLDWVAAADQLKKVHGVFEQTKARYLEVNPWVQTPSH